MRWRPTLIIFSSHARTESPLPSCWLTCLVFHGRNKGQSGRSRPSMSTLALRSNSINGMRQSRSCTTASELSKTSSTPCTHQGFGHPVSELAARGRRLHGQSGVRREPGLLERTRRSCLGTAHRQLRTAGFCSRRGRRLTLLQGRPLGSTLINVVLAFLSFVRLHSPS